MTVNEAVRQLLDVIKTRDFKEESPGKVIEKPRSAVSKLKKNKNRLKHLQNAQSIIKIVGNHWKYTNGLQTILLSKIDLNNNLLKFSLFYSIFH